MENHLYTEKQVLEILETLRRDTHNNNLYMTKHELKNWWDNNKLKNSGVKDITVVMVTELMSKNELSCIL